MKITVTPASVFSLIWKITFIVLKDLTLSTILKSIFISHHKYELFIKTLVNEDTLLRNIVAHDVSWAAQTGKHLLRTQTVSAQNQTHFLCPATNVAHAGKRRNICVGNNVSATMCPRLPGPWGLVRATPKEFQNGVFTLKTHQTY